MGWFGVLLIGICPHLPISATLFFCRLDHCGCCNDHPLPSFVSLLLEHNVWLHAHRLIILKTLCLCISKTMSQRDPTPVVGLRRSCMSWNKNVCRSLYKRLFLFVRIHNGVLPSQDPALAILRLCCTKRRKDISNSMSLDIFLTRYWRVSLVFIFDNLSTLLHIPRCEI